MADLVQVAAEWQKHRMARESYYVPNQSEDGGVCASEIQSEWLKHDTFEDLVDADTSLSEEDKVKMLGAGKKLPTIASNDIYRHQHPTQGYHFYHKSCPVGREEFILSHFAAACDFPYASVLPSLNDRGIVYTPKLGQNLNSLYGYLISQLKRGEDSVPQSLHDCFNECVKTYGSANKISYSSLLKGDGYSFKESFHEWKSLVFEKEQIFISKLEALRSMVMSADSVENPTNIIVNAQTGRFIYAIDQAPLHLNVIESIGTGPIRFGMGIDPDIVLDMQKTMQEKLTDEVIKKAIDSMRWVTLNHKGYNSRDTKDGFLRNDDLLSRYSDLLKYRRDNPALIVDPNTRKPI